MNRVVLAILVLAGLSGAVMRFCALDRKPFWIDEVVTAWNVSGYTKDEVGARLGAAGEVHPAAILAYQFGAEHRPLAATIHALAQGDPSHAPLYYVLLHGWRALFGVSVTSMRAMSAVIGLLSLAGAWVLAWLLFESVAAAWFALALLAVSPFALYYAQTAREYALFLLIVLLSSAALLLAWRRDNGSAWLGYGLALVAGCYVSLLFLPTLAAHAIFALSARADRRRRWRFVMTAAIALILYMPWLLVVVRERAVAGSDLAWLTRAPGFAVYAGRFLGDLAGLFAYTGENLRLAAAFGLAIVVLSGAAVWLTSRQATHDGKLFIAALGLVPVVLIVGADVFLGGQRGLIARYLFQSYIALVLCLAFAFARGGATRPAWTVTALVLIAVGTISCFVQLRQPTAWDANRNAYVGPAAAAINRAPASLVLVEDYKNNLMDATSLCYALDDAVGLRIVTGSAIGPPDGRSVFALRPTPLLREALTARGSSVAPVPGTSSAVLVVTRRSL